jgi:hypothetical protein
MNTTQLIEAIRSGRKEFRDVDLSDVVWYEVYLSLTDTLMPVIEGVPVVPDLPRRVLEAVNEGENLDMSDWHTCDTTHCRAGWHIHLAGDAGYKFARRHSSDIAGSLIYAASCPGRPIPDFFCTNAEAMASIKEDAAKP